MDDRRKAFIEAHPEVVPADTLTVYSGLSVSAGL
jgi:hypothetical protein